MRFDTIVAPITPSGRGGIAVVRLSGPASWEIASTVFQPWPKSPISHRAVYGQFRHGDDGLVLPFAEGHGYTGERSVEMSVHASFASVRALVDASIAEGARMAEPGEFTKRAFLHGRLDLAQAEGVTLTIESETSRQLQAANALRGGNLSRQVDGLLVTIDRWVAESEARIDFSEELGPMDKDQGKREIVEVCEAVARLRQGAGAARLLRQGLRIAIVGPPNAGKSSLLNALLNHERAIVTPVPGTTRDTIEERLDVGGLPVVLIDTAGLRTSQDTVEAIGIQRSLAAAKEADAVWYVYDAAAGWQPTDSEAVAAFSAPLVLGNKADLVEPEVGIAVSALTRHGFDQLEAWIESRFETHDAEIALTERHAELLSRASEALQEALALLVNDGPEDLIATLLLEASSALRRITGRESDADMLSAVFSRFCIGK